MPNRIGEGGEGNCLRLPLKAMRQSFLWPTLFHIRVPVLSITVYITAIKL